jgi:hypothetical protein
MFELKIPKGYSEAINRRRTDNTMIKRKRTKGQTTIYKTLHRKLTTEKHEPKRGRLFNLMETNYVTKFYRK